MRSEKIIDRVCEFCNAQFLAHRISRKFCSDSCKQKALRRRHSPLVKKSCEVCGTSFQQNKRHQKYCSAYCYQRGWQTKNRDRYNEIARKGGKRRRMEARQEPFPCIGCGTFFVRPHANQKYCSHKCYSKYYTKNNRPKVRGYRNKYDNSVRQKTPWMPFFISVKARARKEKLPFDLTVEWAKSVWTGRCALSNVEFELKIKRHPRSPSIDKIDPKKGYLQSNCRFICLAANRFKNDWSDQEIIEIAKGIADHHRPYILVARPGDS